MPTPSKRISIIDSDHEKATHCFDGRNFIFLTQHRFSLAFMMQKDFRSIGFMRLFTKECSLRISYQCNDIGCVMLLQTYPQIFEQNHRFQVISVTLHDEEAAKAGS